MAPALSRTSPISREIGLIAELVSQNITEKGFALPAVRAEDLLARLHTIKRRIANLEHEVGTFRANEQDKATAGVLDDLCMEVMQDGVLDAAKSDPVIYPDFRKGKHS